MSNIIYPPRPKGKILPSMLSDYSTKDWVAQRKFQGQRTVIHIQDKKVSVFGRHGQPHAKSDLYDSRGNLCESLSREFLSLNLQEGKEYWLDSELLLKKTKTAAYKGVFVLFDVLQADKYLIRRTTMERLKILGEICRHPTQIEPHYGIALQVTPHVWMAETFESDFVKHYEEQLDLDEIEGLVLKKREAQLDSFGKKEYEVSWLIRVRKPHRNYNF